MIVLAAGRARRLGQPKALVRMPDGSIWLDRQLDAMVQGGVRHAVLVLGHALQAHRRALPWIDTARATTCFVRGCRVTVVLNLRTHASMAASVRVGARALEAGSSAFVLPVDHPASPSIWRRLNEADASTVIPTFEGRGGHPVRLGPDIVDVCRHLDGARDRLDTVLRRAGASRLTVEDPAVRTNLNRPEDWHRWTVQGARGVFRSHFFCDKDRPQSERSLASSKP